METLDLALSAPSPQLGHELRRFSSDGVVIVRATIANVYIGSTLIGGFDLDDADRGPRNVLAVTLAKSDQFHLGRLARAFKGRHPDGLRIALDAVICALAIGQFAVEGVRRLATPTGATLLRAERVPSASGVRKLLGRLIVQTDGGATLEARMAERLIANAASEDGPAIFYVDGHLRPYTGDHVVRRSQRAREARCGGGEPIAGLAACDHVRVAARGRVAIEECEREHVRTDPVLFLHVVINGHLLHRRGLRWHMGG